jgi:hypothetical protein
MVSLKARDERSYETNHGGEAHLGFLDRDVRLALPARMVQVLVMRTTRITR